MPLRARRALTTAVAAVLAAVSSVVLPSIAGPAAPAAAAGDPDEVIAFVVEGTGNGHGRGLSQWGSFGRSLAGHSWQQILDTYYGGTGFGAIGFNDLITVRLTGLDGAGTTGVVSVGGTARWNGSATNYTSLYAQEVAPNQYNVYGAGVRACPTDVVPADTWTLLGGPVAAVTFTTTVSASASDPGDVLGVCRGDGTVVHYRGDIKVLGDATGANRTVNELRVEDYLRGVIPREVPASWGGAAGGLGMNALRSQAVAARSYGVSQNRYSYAKTCDTSTCQVYGGAATRPSANGARTGLEHPFTDTAIVDTQGFVRQRGGTIVSTEFSASNGPRTAGGAFPPVDDPFDDQPGNPNHRWTRVIDASLVRSEYALSTANGVRSENDPNEPYDGIWDQRVRLSNGGTVSNWDFRGDFGLPSPGFTLIPITRAKSTEQLFALVGDSVGVSVTENATSELPALIDGVFAATHIDAKASRCTVGCAVIPDGVGAARGVPIGTDVVIVELGYNDPGSFASKIDAVMTELRARNVTLVGWVNLSQRRGDAAFATANQALLQARARWPELRVLDWNLASSGTARDRWFSDSVHLTATGQAEFGRWLRDRVLALATEAPSARKVVPGVPLRIPVLGRGGVPSSGVAAVAVNVTAVHPDDEGYLTVWPCGSPMPEASNVNYRAGGIEPNSVLVRVDGTGEVCVFTYSPAHVLVDVAGWFASGFTGVVPNRIVDTRNGVGAPRAKVTRGAPLRVPVLGRGGFPGSGVGAVALNVTAVHPDAEGYLTVWPCGSPMPEASNVNYRAGGIEPNSVLVPVDGTGEVCIFTWASSHVLVDTAGWFASGFSGVVPNRIVDTRNGVGAPRAKVAPAAPLRVPVLGRGGVPGSGVVAVALNVTAVHPDGEGYLTVWPCGSPRPEASNVNYRAGGIEPNSVLVRVDGTGEVCVYTFSPAHVVIDTAGWFSAGFTGVVPARIVDTRNGIGPRPGR